ncbi:O-antigen ligase [Acinetobacter sp. YH12064]|uniref:O-antigen ligase family protein n=1 Tax=Acinetobacter sp. YH12064 TaxID=2601062 RepID=UPI0015D2825F|nr:O-antigen polymerase [Acinetobacter sp. YH12064]
MGIDLLKIKKESLGFLFFLMIYPLDFISYMISSNWGLEIPIGFVGSLISIFIFLFFYFFISSKRNLIIYIFVCVFAVFMGYLMWISNNANLLDYFYLLKISGAFCCGILFFSFLRKTDAKKIKNIILFFWILMFLLIFNFDLGENYLRLSDAFALVCLLYISMLDKIKYQVLFLILSVMGLYFLESRAGLLLFLLSVVPLIFLKNNFLKFSLVLSPIVLLAYYYILRLNESILNYNDNRFLRLIFSTDSDTSLNERKYLNEMGWETFLSNKFVGDFGYYKYSLGEGSYAHNYISFLAEFGVLGLFILVAFLIFCLISLFKLYTSKTIFYFDYIVLSFILFGLFGVLFAKSFYWLYFFFCFGVIFSYYSSFRSNGNVRKVSL